MDLPPYVCVKRVDLNIAFLCSVVGHSNHCEVLRQGHFSLILLKLCMSKEQSTVIFEIHFTQGVINFSQILFTDSKKYNVIYVMNVSFSLTIPVEFNNPSSNISHSCEI